MVNYQTLLFFSVLKKYVELNAGHTENYMTPPSNLAGTNPLNRSRLDMSMFADLPIKSFVRLHCGGIGVDLDTTWNEMHTSSAARMAAGCVVDLAFKGMGSRLLEFF